FAGWQAARFCRRRHFWRGRTKTVGHRPCETTGERRDEEGGAFNCVCSRWEDAGFRKLGPLRGIMGRRTDAQAKAGQVTRPSLVECCGERREFYEWVNAPAIPEGGERAWYNGVDSTGRRVGPGHPQDRGNGRQEPTPAAGARGLAGRAGLPGPRQA